MRYFLREKNKNFKFFSKKSLLRILSLRFSADFRRSRLVHIFSNGTCEIIFLRVFIYSSKFRFSYVRFEFLVSHDALTLSILIPIEGKFCFMNPYVCFLIQVEPCTTQFQILKASHIVRFGSDDFSCRSALIELHFLKLVILFQYNPSSPFFVFVFNV